MMLKAKPTAQSIYLLVNLYNLAISLDDVIYVVCAGFTNTYTCLECFVTTEFKLRL